MPPSSLSSFFRSARAKYFRSLIYRIHQFLAFSLDRRRLPTLPSPLLRASCVGSISLPLRQVSASFSLPLSLSPSSPSLSFSLPPDRANLLSFFHSVLSFPRSSLHVRRSPRHERSKEGIAEWQCRWAYRRALISAFRARRLSIPRDKGPTATAAAHPDL